jgi:hypothetical protein
MKKLAIFFLMLLGAALAARAQTSMTPNIGLQIPAFNQTNWQVPINYDLNQLDLFLSGHLSLPALMVSGNLTCGTSNCPWGNFVTAGGVQSLILDGTATKQVSGGPELLSCQNAAANHVCLASFSGSEANARFLIDIQGNHEWGPGGSTDQNVLLAWSATGRLNLSGTSGGGLNIVRWTSPGVQETQPRISLSNDGSGLLFSDGTNAADVNIYRPSAQQFNVVGIGAPVTGCFSQSTDTNCRVAVVAADPSIKFGDGTITPVEKIYRSTAGQLNFSGAVGFGALQAADTNPRFLLDTANNRLAFGPGNAVVDMFVTRGAGPTLGITGGNVGIGTTSPTNALTVNGTASATAYATATNCAVNSASPAACGSAAAGAFVVPTTTTTYTVNTSAVTAHSRVFVQPITFASDLPSSPTCVAPLLTTDYSISAVSNGVSFTMALTSTTGQTCWQFWVVN